MLGRKRRPFASLTLFSFFSAADLRCTFLKPVYLDLLTQPTRVELVDNLIRLSCVFVGGGFKGSHILWLWQYCEKELISIECCVLLVSTQSGIRFRCSCCTFIFIEKTAFPCLRLACGFWESNCHPKKRFKFWSRKFSQKNHSGLNGAEQVYQRASEDTAGVSWLTQNTANTNSLLVVILLQQMHRHTTWWG